MIRLAVILFAVIAFGGISRAADEVFVEVWYRSASPCAGGVDQYWFDEGEAITINANDCVERINIYTSSAFDIGAVTITGSGPTGTNRLQVLISSGAFTSAGQQATTACDDFGGLTIVNTTLRSETDFAGHFAGNLTGSIGVGQMYRLDIDGSMNASIISEGAPNGFCRLIVGATSPAGDFQLDANNLILFDCTGNAAGDVTAKNGHVLEVSVGGSLTGSVCSENGQIQLVEAAIAIGSVSVTPNIHAKGSIFTVEAPSIKASISSRAFTGTTGTVFRVATSSGDFEGSLTTTFLTTDAAVTGEGVFVAGDLDASITATSDVRVPISVAGNINGNISISGHLWTGNTSDGSIETTSGGDINGNISITGNIEGDSSGAAFIKAADDINGAITATGDLQSNGTNHGRIECAGDLDGNITIAGMADGVIDINGSFTSGTIDLAGDLDGTISIGNSGAGSITGGTIDIADDINGTITVADDIQASGSIVCAGDVNANITVTDDLAGLINIGGSLLSAKTIAAQSLSIAYDLGQIIINSLNPGTPGTWAGSVVINSTALSPTPHYSNEDLVGAVGLVPFALHDADCIPENGQANPSDFFVDLSF